MVFPSLIGAVDCQDRRGTHWCTVSQPGRNLLGNIATPSPGGSTLSGSPAIIFILFGLVCHTSFCFCDICLSVLWAQYTSKIFYPLLTDGQTGAGRVLQWRKEPEQYCSSTRHRQQQVCRELLCIRFCVQPELCYEYIWYNFLGLYYI